MQQVGDGQQGDNPVLGAHHEVSRRVRQQAPDSGSRDLGIIANYLNKLSLEDAATR